MKVTSRLQDAQLVWKAAVRAQGLGKGPLVKNSGTVKLEAQRAWSQAASREKRTLDKVDWLEGGPMAYLFPVTITSFSLSWCYSVTSILWSEGQLCLCLWTLCSLQALPWQLYAQIQWLGPGWKSAD